MEIWKPIKGFENQYEISNLGNLRSKDRIVKHYVESFTRKYKGQSKKLRLSKDGYLRCTLKNDGKIYHYRVHRLVAEAFIENKDLLNIVNHLNGNKIDNRAENLEWCNSMENNIHAVKLRLIKTKLTDNEALEIFNSKLSNRKLALQYNIDSTIVWRIKNKKAYKHLWHKHYS
jgi:hypothetical protein